MKKIIILLLVLSCSVLEAQNSEVYKIIASNVISVGLDAFGDGLRDKAWQYHDSDLSKWGHMAQAGSIGALLVVPLYSNYTFNDWCFYIASYVFTRIAIFDPIYNLTRGFEWNYKGSSSHWDESLKGFNIASETVLRTFSFSVAIIIPLAAFK